jgi:hypothetical protein
MNRQEYYRKNSFMPMYLYNIKVKWQLNHNSISKIDIYIYIRQEKKREKKENEVHHPS